MTYQEILDKIEPTLENINELYPSSDDTNSLEIKNFLINLFNSEKVYFQLSEVNEDMYKIMLNILEELSGQDVDFKSFENESATIYHIENAILCVIVDDYDDSMIEFYLSYKI